ncbi:restriction endonuclease subunit S [Enterococcus avium]|uniref:restriction endonuclease subunit S n=1 Tax=Enterococcus avium TaxID=33945 RepID=UPI002891C000|nr:restriction endonuclease subunit S [Enterococcus avium]MDT2391129.1 restriction endonuclease subunit S [Enterococcus avium]
MSNDTQPEIRFPGFTEDWEQRKLGEVVESVGTGRSTFTNGIVQTSETPYAVLGSTSVISYDSMFDHSGDFILTARVGANAGNLYKYFGEVKISDNTVYIQANNLDFIYYLLTKYDLKRLSFGTGQPLVKASEVKNLKLNFPQKNEEQQKIGSFFKQLDDTIALHQRKLDLLKETKKGFLQKMFPKNGAKVPEIRFPGFTEDWEQRKAKELFIPKAEKNQPELPVLSVTQDHGVVYREQVGIDIKYDKATLKNYKVIHQGDFVISLRSFQGGFELSDKLGITSPAYTIFVPKNMDSQDNLFWKTKFKTFTFIESLKTVTFGIRDGKSISFSEFGDLKLFFPKNIEEQQKIGNFFKQLDDTITLHQRKLDLLKEMKKGFLQKMFV